MRTYQVWLKGMERMIEIRADDVELDGDESRQYWNFIAGKDNTTVAVVPFHSAEYIVSQEGEAA